MRGKKENNEFEFGLPDEKQYSTGEKVYSTGEKRYSAGEVVMYAAVIVALVVALIILGVLIWRVSRGLFQTDEKETVEVVQGLEEENSGTESDADEGLEEETSGESGQESKAEVSAEAEDSGTETGEGDAGTQSGQESVTAGSAVSETEVSESQSASSGNTSEEGQQTETQDTSTSPTGMTFTEVSETVMAKSATNLRSEPSTESADTVVLVLESGIQVTRTGINTDTGWSRLSYDGQVLYAVSSLLTTDLTGQTTGEVAADPDRVTTQDGRVIIFTACDDTVTPKMSVNLRTEPSTSQGDATVYYELQYGETVRRTGYDQDAGWSRVEYNGQTLYAVTSYLYIVE